MTLERRAQRSPEARTGCPAATAGPRELLWGPLRLSSSRPPQRGNSRRPRWGWGACRGCLPHAGIRSRATRRNGPVGRPCFEEKRVRALGVREEGSAGGRAKRRARGRGEGRLSRAGGTARGPGKSVWTWKEGCPPRRGPVRAVRPGKRTPRGGASRVLSV